MEITVSKIKINFRKKPNDDQFRVQGKIYLDNGADILRKITVSLGLLLSETVMLTGRGDEGDKWEYKRPQNYEGRIKQIMVDRKNCKFDIRMDRADLEGIHNPLTISLKLGKELVEEIILMNEKRHHWGYKARRSQSIF